MNVDRPKFKRKMWIDKKKLVFLKQVSRKFFFEMYSLKFTHNFQIHQYATYVFCGNPDLICLCVWLLLVNMFKQLSGVMCLPSMEISGYIGHDLSY